MLLPLDHKTGNSSRNSNGSRSQKAISNTNNASSTVNRGFADVQFEQEADAEAAIDNMEGAEVLGKVLRVRKSVKEARQIDHRKAGKCYILQLTTTKPELTGFV